MMRGRTIALRTWESSTRLTEADLASAWTAYRATGGDADRNRLLEHYLPTVKACCEWIHSRLPRAVEMDDVMSAGIEGLRRALKSFDPARQVRFETYLSARARGAVLDALRSMDVAPRLLRRRAAELARATEAVTTEHGRPPTPAELAGTMGLSEKKVGRLQREVEALQGLSLDRTCEGNGGRPISEGDFFADLRADTPDRRLQRDDLKRLLLKGLTKTERHLLILYYYEEMTMKEVGATLNLSESRISQLHADLLERLREGLKDCEPEFLPADG